ncbi:MAG: DUF1624 domain-containing protein [Asgard group archaeon]|nr:DUF1624 domain-containing protein [Asgard group archaeon]
MNIDIQQKIETKQPSKRFLTIDLTRAFAIIGMIFLHMVWYCNLF